MIHSAGIHHVTAICGDPRRNYDFYTKTLGLRFIKKTVNFDDPGTYHLYYGDERGSPGAALTFFPWAGSPQGRVGSGETLATAFIIPEPALAFWLSRLTQKGLAPQAQKRFGADVLTFRDPDAMALELITTPGAAAIAGYGVSDVPAAHAIRGFHSVTLGVSAPADTAAVLTRGFSWKEERREGARIRYTAGGPATALGGHVDLIAAPGAAGRQGVGSVHHVAFRAHDDSDQAKMVEALHPLGIAATEQKNRFYFRSVYFREPGRVLFEIATDAPGFTADEPLESLGTALRLPPQYESIRAKIEAALPPL